MLVLNVRPIFEGGALADDDIPVAVRASLRMWCEVRKLPLEPFRAALRWDILNGCYAFWFGDVLYGVEKSDGRIHT